MVEKMKIAVAKLKETTIHSYMTHIVFNTCIMKSIYFGCGIVELHLKQEQILQKTYEETILQKIGLSKKFPQ